MSDWIGLPHLQVAGSRIALRPIVVDDAAAFGELTEYAQGSAVNPAAKFLLLQHAFEVAGTVRVVWHTHSENAQSRSAIEKLGANFEGLLRKHRRFGDGWRTTTQYAITDDD